MPTEPIEKYRDTVKPNEKGQHHPETPHEQENHVMSEEEKLDEMIDESFPASDPPGHISKSVEDKNLH
jgi:hypothetical protein